MDASACLLPAQVVLSSRFPKLVPSLDDKCVGQDAFHTYRHAIPGRCLLSMLLVLRRSCALLPFTAYQSTADNIIEQTVRLRPAHQTEKHPYDTRMPTGDQKYPRRQKKAYSSFL